jgi:hypothetical protein
MYAHDALPGVSLAIACLLLPRIIGEYLGILMAETWGITLAVAVTYAGHPVKEIDVMETS